MPRGFYLMFTTVEIRYNMNMNSLLRTIPSLLIGSAILLTGCTYHGKIRRGTFRHQPGKNKIEARMMVVADRYYPPYVAADPWGRYIYKMYNGLPEIVAEALSTLFTEVKVDNYENRYEYDFITEIDYEGHIGIGPSKFTYADIMLPYYTNRPVLTTTLKLTIRNPKTGYAVARYNHDTHHLVETYRTDPGLFATHLLTFCSLGILYPLDIQAFGSTLRKTIEYGINRDLYWHILPEMREDRLNFTPTHETEKTNVRVDGKFIPFMKATVYITTGDGLGSGFFISPDGYIITNAHVVGHNRDVGVILYDSRHLMDKTNPTDFPDKDTIRNKVLFARLLKINKKRDLALLKLEGENYPWLELETDRKAYTTGRKVVAIGAPKGIEWSATQGTISATRDRNGADTIQTDAAINNGNSGGPLIDLETGKVIGVNSWGRDPRTEEELYQNIESLSFAISAYEVQRTLGVQQPMNANDYPKPTDSNLQTIPKEDRNYVQYY